MRFFKKISDSYGDYNYKAKEIEMNLDDFMHPFAENSPTNHQAAARKRKSKRYRKKSVGTMIKIKHLKDFKRFGQMLRECQMQ